MRHWIYFLVLGMVLVPARYFQARYSFESQRQVFPEPCKGLFLVQVGEEPEVLFDHSAGSHDTGRLGGYYQPFVREVRAVCEVLSRDGVRTPSVKARCAFLLSADHPRSTLAYGDTVEIEGKIQYPASARNPGQFDYAHYLKTKGVAYVIYGAPGCWNLLKSEKTIRNPFLASSFGMKRWAEDALYRYLPFPENALLTGILLGERGPLPSDMTEAFMVTGTVHILAVSGMVTAFLAGLFFLIFRALQFGRKWAAALSLAALLFFIFMTGAHPPVCRAGLFSALALTGVLLERKIHGGTLLLATALLLAVINPFVLEDLSFQISFLATAGLMVLASRFLEMGSFIWKPAALLISTTAAAQVSVWCLIIHSFNQSSPYSLLANLLIVPLALFSVAGGLAMLIGCWIHPLMGVVFGSACEIPLRFLIVLADWIAKLPCANTIVASPPVAWTLCFHFLLLAFFAAFWPVPEPENPSPAWKKRRGLFQRAQRMVCTAWILFLALSTGIGLASTLRTQPWRMAFLSMGHGNALVLRTPHGKVLVFDGGRETHGPDRYHPLVAYLRHLGIRKVDAVFNTHPDEDHVGGLANLLAAYPVGEAFEGNGARSASAIYRRFEALLKEKRIRHEELKMGDIPFETDQTQVLMLHPSPSFHPLHQPDNNRSMVSEVDFPFGGRNFTLILPGDLEREGLTELLRTHRPFPKVDWLLAPHHGRWSGAQDLCASSMKPHFTVLSDWRDYPDDHDLYKASVPDAVVLSTAREGSIEVEVWPAGWGRYRTFQDKKWKSF